MEYSNGQILAAVLAEFFRPALNEIAVNRLNGIQLVQQAEEAMRSWGLVGPGYRLATELAPFVKGSMDGIAIPILEGMLARIPDEAIPGMARALLRNAMKESSVCLLDGMITLSKDDMCRLMRLIDLNLPEEDKHYEVAFE